MYSSFEHTIYSGYCIIITLAAISLLYFQHFIYTSNIFTNTLAKCNSKWIRQSGLIRIINVIKYVTHINVPMSIKETNWDQKTFKLFRTVLCHTSLCVYFSQIIIIIFFLLKTYNIKLIHNFSISIWFNDASSQTKCSISCIKMGMVLNTSINIPLEFHPILWIRNNDLLLFEILNRMVL